MIEGGCRCGAVRYALALDTLPLVYACHCHQCQRWSGSAFSLQAIVPEDALAAISGPVETYPEERPGYIATQYLCGICHSRIYNPNPLRPGSVMVRAGTLDHSEELQCAAHIHTASRQSWVEIADTVPSWPGAPSPDAFFALFMQ